MNDLAQDCWFCCVFHFLDVGFSLCHFSRVQSSVDKPGIISFNSVHFTNINLLFQNLFSLITQEIWNFDNCNFYVFTWREIFYKSAAVVYFAFMCFVVLVLTLAVVDVLFCRKIMVTQNNQFFSRNVLWKIIHYSLAKY